MSCPHRIQFLPRRRARVRSITLKGSNGWGRSYTPMNQLSQPETATRMFSSRSVTHSSRSVPHTVWMEMGNPLGVKRGLPRLVSGRNGYDSCIRCTSSYRRWPSEICLPPTILASAKSTQCTAGIKYPGQWFAIDEARSTWRSTHFRHGQPPFRHYLSPRRMQLDAPQH